MNQFRFRHTTLIILCLGSFLAGLGLARLDWRVPIAFIWLSLLFVMVLLRRKNLVLAVFVSIFGLSLGLVRGGKYVSLLTKYYDFYNNKIVVVGTATDDGVYVSGGRLSFDLDHLTVIDPVETELVGKIGVQGFGERAIYRGDVVEVEGKLYKTRGSRQGNINFGELKILSRSTLPVDNIRRRFKAGMLSSLPEPLASFALGLLIGQRSTLPESFALALATVGLTHIVAVSGYNLTIIVRGVRRFLKKLSKYQSTVVCLTLIGLFLLFTGFSPSIVRAAIVSALSLMAWYYGRQIRPLLIILIAAALTAGFYPIYLWSDIGWYLSFLAFFGVLIIAPLLARRIYKNKNPKPIMFIALESLSAQMMTLPLIMFIFGEFSAIALLANIIIVPFVSLAMLLALIAGIAGMLIPQIVGWLAWPARVLLTYMLDIIQLLARVPHVLVRRNMFWWQMLILYLIIVLITIILWHKTRSKNATITDKETGIL